MRYQQHERAPSIAYKFTLSMNGDTVNVSIMANTLTKALSRLPVMEGATVTGYQRVVLN